MTPFPYAVKCNKKKLEFLLNVNRIIVISYLLELQDNVCCSLLSCVSVHLVLWCSRANSSFLEARELMSVYHGYWDHRFCRDCISTCPWLNNEWFNLLCVSPIQSKLHMVSGIHGNHCIWKNQLESIKTTHNVQRQTYNEETTIQLTSVTDFCKSRFGFFIYSWSTL